MALRELTAKALQLLPLAFAACASGPASSEDPAVGAAEVAVAPPATSAAPSVSAPAQPSGKPGLLQRLLGGDPRIRECNQLIEAVNASTIGDSVGVDPKQLEAESKEALRLERQIAKLQLSDTKLVALVSEYKDTLTSYGTMMKQAMAADPNDADAMAKLVQKAGEVATRSSEMTAKLNEYCKR